MIKEGMAVREIIFVEELPPDAPKRQTDWAITLKVLRDNPMKWALVKKFDSSANAYNGKKCMEKHLSFFKDAKKFELVMKRPEIGKWAIYALYRSNDNDNDKNKNKVVENEL